MKPRYKVSRAGIELIKSFEGYRRSAAQLSDGRWTIGYGHTKTARQGAQVSEDDADALLQYDLMSVAAAVNDLTFTPLTQNQFDALVSFASNVGIDAFHKSMVLRRVNEGAMLQAAGALEMWRKADFEGEQIVVDALVRRRAAEKALFLTPPDGWVAAPSPVLPPKFDADGGASIPAERPVELKASLEGAVATVERETPEIHLAPEAPVETAGNVLEMAAAAISAPHFELAHAPTADAEREPTVAPAATPIEAPASSLADEPSVTPSLSQMADASQMLSARLEAILPSIGVTTAMPETRTDLDLPTPPSTPTEPLAEAPVEIAQATSTAEPELFERPSIELPWSNPIAYSPAVEHDPAERAEPTVALADLFQRPIYREQPLDDDHAFDGEEVKPANLSFAPYLLVTVVGLVIVAAGATLLFSARSTGGGLNPMVIGVPVALVGIAMVGWSVYSLFSRFSGHEEV